MGLWRAGAHLHGGCWRGRGRSGCAVGTGPWAPLGLSVRGDRLPRCGEGGPRLGEAHQRGSALRLGPLRVALGSGRGPFLKSLRSGPVRSLSNFTFNVTRLRMRRLTLAGDDEPAVPQAPERS